MSEYSRPVLNPRISKTHKEYEKNDLRERRKSLMHLILSYLRECNLHETSECLIAEAQISDQFVVCDNIDLDIVLQDYQSYYQAKFNKTAKIIRRIETATDGKNGTPAKRKTKVTTSSGNNGTIPQLKPAKLADSSSVLDFRIDVTNLSSSSEEKTDEECVKKSLCDHPNYSGEWREMADLIVKEIVGKDKLKVTWCDCVGVQGIVESIKEACVYPRMYPDLFTGLLEPWKGILLYGPPGTGKTLLAKALANETSSTFINLTISTFVSKWRGDSEKLLKVLFDVARLYAPTTIFIDELDAIASKYEDSQHDASRRFKSELLVQLDGLLSGDDGVFVLATTNSPWNLNNAILRRFEKRILLNVPDAEARAELFEHYFRGQSKTFHLEDFRWMAGSTANFSAADIKHVTKEVFMSLVRDKLRNIRNDKGAKRDLRTPNREDVMEAIKKYHPSCDNQFVEKYNEWAKKYGSL